MPDGRAMRVSVVVRIGLPMLAGGLQAISIASPWDGQPQGGLQLFSLGLLAWLLLRQVWSDESDPVARGPSAAGLGWLYATAWLAGSFWWMFIAMHRYGGLPAPLAALAVLALSDRKSVV